MRRIIILLLAFMIVSCSSCGITQKPAKEPQVSEMKSICELATMDCYYHNVAKYKEEDASGFLFWKKDKHFWIEYAGIVTIGIDASLVDIEVEDEQVTIKIPPAKVLSCKVDEDTLSEDSFIIDKNSADIDAQDQTEVFKAAQNNMKESAAQDSTLLTNAQARAQKLLEDYVNNIGELIGKQYKIKWVYLEADEIVEENEEENTEDNQSVETEE
ncbi:MAG: DUF4230 domain-containing protein [Lachnospiraceae bacterium]|nr:DUF4230 domain-containing protein [Lachnospiraceae bacterium]